MVSSRQRSSTASDQGIQTRVPKATLDEWTTREKLCLTSLAIKHNNSWNSVARHMQAFLEKDRPEGWSNQKTCAAQFDKLMNELGVDKRPRRNEPSDGNSSAVIYRKMAEKRIKELEESIIEARKQWLNIRSDIESAESSTSATSFDKSGDQPAAKQKIKAEKAASTAAAIPSAAKQQAPASKQANTSMTSAPTTEAEKPSTRALTRRESSRQNLEKTLSVLWKEASEIKSIHTIGKPSKESEKQYYDETILKQVDLSTIKKRLGGEVDDPYAVINDLLIMLQNATMFYPHESSVDKTTVELRNRLVPQWEKNLIERFKTKH